MRSPNSTLESDFVAPRRRPPLTALALFFVGIGLAAFVGKIVRAAREHAVLDDFRVAADEISTAVRLEVSDHIWALTALRSLMESSPDVDDKRFRDFAAPLFLSDSTLEGCSWLQRVPRGERAYFEATVLAGRPDGTGIAELDADGCLVPAGERDEYAPVTLSEPRDRFARWQGFDLASEAVRGDALKRACETGQAAASDPIQIQFDPTSPPGVLIAMPVFAGGVQPEDVEDRRAALRGYVVAGFHVGPMVERALARMEHQGIRFSLFDSMTPDGSTLFYGDPIYQSHYGMLPILEQSPLRRQAALAVSGQDWSGACNLDPAVYASQVGFAGWTSFWFGCLISLTVTSYLTWRAWREQELNLRNRQLASLVAEREAAVAGLRESEERFRAMFENHHASMWLIDSDDWRIVDANPAAVEFYGYSRDELRGMHISAINSMPRERLADLFETSCQNHANYFVVPHKKKNGEERRVEVYTTPIEYQGRRLMFSILHDITDRLRAEADRESIQAQLVQSQKLESLGLLAGGIAHDFNNLLTAIHGNAELALLRAGDNRAMLECLEPLVRTSERAAELTHKLLSYAGKAPFELKPADLSQIVREFTPLLSGLIPRNVRFDVDVRHRLPDVLCDTIQIQQVVMNLVLNAAEACGTKAALVSVTTGVLDVDAAAVTAWSKGLAVAAELQPGKYAFIEVRDDGSGIDAATLARIFDPFFTTKFTGRGLGLATVSGIVRTHGGGLEVRSQPGIGSRFRAYFPACVVAPPAALPEAKHTERTGGVVLVVDDEPVVLGVARDILEHYGFEVVTAASGRAAVEIVRERAVDIAMLDMTMPEMNGLETLVALRELRPDLPAILASGYSEPEATKLFTGENLAGFVQKPYSAKTLAAKIRAALSLATSE